MMKHASSSLVILPLAVLAGCILAGCELGGNPGTGANNSSGNSTFTDNSRFFGTYTGMITTVNGSAWDTHALTVNIGDDWSRRNQSWYIYVPLTDTQITFTDTNTFSPYTETLTVWDDSITVHMEDDTGSADVRLSFADDYNSFTYENTEYTGTQISQHNGNFARPGTSGSTTGTMRMKQLNHLPAEATANSSADNWMRP